MERYMAADLASSPLLTESAAAELLSVSVPTVRAWRVRNQGPAYVKLSPRGDGSSGAIRYRRADLFAFVEANMPATMVHPPSSGDIK
jgi:hypothetical protein